MDLIESTIHLVDMDDVKIRMCDPELRRIPLALVIRKKAKKEKEACYC